ncbi:hypothetical protein ACHAWF_004840 [Thalassiosira exigua]
MEFQPTNPSPLIEDHGPVQVRDRFSSRFAFFVAAIGSAIGFGNVWRFPSLVYEFGGGAFFLPYLLALFLFGIPLLVLEVAQGQHYEAGAYYSMLLAWTLNAFFQSFGEGNFWAQEQVTGTEAKQYFYENIIGTSTLGDDLLPTRVDAKNSFYSLLTWTLIYFSVAYGMEWTSRITNFTVGLPIVLLFVFLGRSVTLEGSGDGIYEYIGDSNWSVLTEKPAVWSRAVSQIFFSLGVTFGVMTAYGSHCKKNEPAFMNSCTVAITNSFIAGFAVFATLGHLALLEGHDSVSDLEYSSFGLVFGSWPVALGTMPGGEHWIRAFFVMLFFLGIDSAFAHVECVLTVLSDTKIEHFDKRWASALVSFGTFLLSLIYATDAGLIFLDTVDYYINFVMIFIGFLKCFVAGWIYKIEGQIESLGANIVFAYMTTTFVSLLLACVCWFGLGELALGFAGLVLFYTIGMLFVFNLMRERKGANPDLKWKDMCYDLYMKNVMDLRSDLSRSAGYLPVIWAVLIKHVIPPVLLVLFFLGADATTSDADGNEVKVFGRYGGYPTQPYQVLGVLTVVFVSFLFGSSLVFPQWYDVLQKSDGSNAIDPTPANAVEMKSTKANNDVEDEPAII